MGIFALRIEGFCPICEQDAVFLADTTWFRESLICQSCVNGSVPRERAAALMLSQYCPNWRTLNLHESSPAERGLSIKLKRECAGYVGTQFFPGRPLGVNVSGWRNEDLQALTFADESFDLVVTLDVGEHVLAPELMFAEVFRTLRPGGLYVSTFPIRKWLVEPVTPLVELGAGGELRHLKEPEFHGNPVNDQGSLVMNDFGYDVHRKISEWTDFDVQIVRFSDRSRGILGEYTEVVLCWKRR